MGDGSSEEENGGGEADRARDMLEYIESQVERGEVMGVDFSEVRDMLSGARIMMESGEFEGALELIAIATEKAGRRFSEHEMLVVHIRKAEVSIKAAHQSGKDVSEAAGLLRLARSYMESGDYLLGIESAKRVLESLARRKPIPAAWDNGHSEP